MSVFHQTQVECPGCGTEVTFKLVQSVNAARRTDLREAILNRTFQRQPCPTCGTSFRVEPNFTYVDIKRKQFFAVWPAQNVENWREFETRSQASHDKSFGPGSDGEALAGSLYARCIFGWLGLNEKLIAHEHGIDDVDLEAAKMATMRTVGDVKLDPQMEFRLVGVSVTELGIAWLVNGSEDVVGEYSVPRQILKDIQAEPDKWAKLKADVSGGMFVDYRRALLG